MIKGKMVVTITTYYESESKESYEKLLTHVENKIQENMQGVVGLFIPADPADKIHDVDIDVNTTDLS